MRYVAVLALCALCSGCAVYSVQRFGPEDVHGTTLNELIQQNGAPDVIGGNAELMVVGYTRTEGFEVLGIFSNVRKTTTGMVVDKTGKVVSTGTSAPGRGMTILGTWTSPVGVAETK